MDIAANTVQLQKDVQKIQGQFDGLVSISKTVGSALAAAFTVTAVVGLGKQVIDFAGHLTDLSAKTQISTTGLQLLGAVFEQSGISLDTVSSATVKLAKNLIDGDKSTVGALNKLGLSVRELKNLAPEQQFLKVADAIGGIQNPTEKAWASMQIFGKGGAELLAGFDGHLQEAAQHAKELGLVIDEQTVKAADDFGDQLGILGKQLLGIVATVVGPLLPALSALGNILSWLGREVIGPVLGGAVKLAMTVLAGFVEAVTGVLGKLAELGSHIPGVGGKFAALAETLRDVSKRSGDYVANLWTNTEHVGKTASAVAPAMIGLGKATEESARAAERAADAEQRLLVSMGHRNQEIVRESLAVVTAYGRAWLEFAKLRDKAVEGMSNTTHIRGLDIEIVNKSIADMGATGIENLGIKIPPMVAKGTSEGFARAVAALPNILQQAFTGGGGFKGAFQALSSLVGGSFGEGLFKAGGLLNGLGNKLTGIFGSSLGLALPGIGQALGAVIGPLVGKLGSAIGKLFGNTAEKQVNPVRQAYIDAAGGLAALNQRAAEAGVTLHAVLDAKTPEAYKKAIDDLNRALQFQDDAMKTLEETTKRYGFTIDELGPAFQRQQLDKQAQQLYQDFRVLTAAGISTDTVLGRMGDSINTFVHNALRTGTEIPAAMAPMLQRMVEMGTLTDANGNVITDLEKSGVHFSMTMTEGFQKIVDAVTKLTDAISRGLGLAIQNIPAPNITGHVGWEVDPIPGAPNNANDWESPNIPMMAQGGIVSTPTLAMIGEGREPEAVIPLSRLEAMRRGGPVADFTAMRNELQALRAETARQREYFESGQYARDQARATRDELQKRTAMRR